jgi:predicted unusual protein kinase regulating ubiquinone biosynthesis (AarF/ABC1/UbiB family)
LNRSEIGQWISRVTPIEKLVPDDVKHWRPLVQDAFQYVFAHLSEDRLQSKISEQMMLPLDTPAEQRLLRLISRMPALQKLGQVLARNRRISAELRTALAQLENGISEVTAAEARAIIESRLADRLERYAVRIAAGILSEASVSAVVRFSWCHPGRERAEGVFKLMKPHVPSCFGEDMSLLQQLGEYLAEKNRRYDFDIRQVQETLVEVRLLLEHELDFVREQATLGDAARMYRSSFGIRVPRLIPELCAQDLTAMSAEDGVKVTEASRRSPIRRERIAGQIVEALIAVPLFTWDDGAVFHADPHAGNLLYDDPNRELVVLDWALAERLDRETRRQLVLLALMTILRNRRGVCAAIDALSARDRQAGKAERIRDYVAQLFARSRGGKPPGVLDAMLLLEQIGLAGVRFPAAMFLFPKVLLTLDGVLHDVVGHEVAIDRVILREFAIRAVASFGFFHAPLKAGDFVSLQRDALYYPFRVLTGV